MIVFFPPEPHSIFETRKSFQQFFYFRVLVPKIEERPSSEFPNSKIETMIAVGSAVLSYYYRIDF